MLSFETLARNIERIRDQLDMSVKALVETVGVSVDEMQRYLRGELVMDSARLYRCAEALGAGVLEMLSSEEGLMFFVCTGDLSMW